MMLSSDLSGFNNKPFNVNHQWTDSKQSDSREITVVFMILLRNMPSSLRCVADFIIGLLNIAA